MPTTYPKTDQQIQTAVVKELDWSPGVESAHIGVAVTDGAVTLSGEVTTLPQRTAAVTAARRIHCVLALVDDIEVRPHDGHHDDAGIVRDVNAALGRHVQLSDALVRATVHQGTVTLEGTVDWHFQREAARRSIETIAGVVDVVDRMAVRVATTQSDAEDGIRAALERGARQDASRVRVSVVGHEVTLRGSVQSWKARTEAEQAAWSARGITSVQNDLDITP